MRKFSPFVFSRDARFVVAVFVSVFAALAAPADGLRALPEGKLPNDRRLGPLKDLNGYFPFKPSPTPEAWAKRAEHVRRQMLVSQGLWPMPEKTPLNAVIHGRIERPDYTVEKVFFESAPGFFVTGNLYRPKGKAGKLPGILCPHGHWPQGRLTDTGAEKILREIVDGAERFEEGGRSPLQARCVTLARMGCVVFHYDMVGYVDSQQLSYELVHRFGKPRPEMNNPESWGFFSGPAESRLQSPMGLQSLNGVRALDFITSLPDVDPARIGVTGASGGGTQTFMLCAMDPRPAVAFPAVMVSTAMQGGCTCENSCLLRVDTGNVEFAAMFAPKPLGMTAANDWTKEMETKGFPELKQHFKMLGAPNNAFLKPALHFGHNYNFVSRSAMYSWMNRHLKLGLKEPVVEQDYTRLTEQEISVWDTQHPKPPSGPDFERKLTRWLADDAQRQVSAARTSPEKYRGLVGGALEVMIGRTLDQVGPVEWVLANKEQRGGYIEMSGLLRVQNHGEELPVLFLHPKNWNGRTVVWADERGKAGLFAAGGGVLSAVQSLLDAGATVMGIDLLGQGEFQADGKALTKARRVNNPREAAAYTLAYNPSLFAERTRDLLSVIVFIRDYQKKTKTLDLVGFGGAAGAWVAAARALGGDAVQHAAVDTAGFRFAKITDWQDTAFLPGGAKYDDMPGLLALSAPAKLWLAGEGAKAPEATAAAYRGAEAKLAVSSASGAESATAAVKWLLAE